MYMRPVKPKRNSANRPRPKPKAELGQCALLRAVTVTKTGAFMDCGLERDLLVPISQQLTPMVEGQSYVVYLFLDPNQNVIGSTKLHNFLDERAKNMAPGEQVDLLIVNESELGFKAVINGTHLGLLCVPQRHDGHVEEEILTAWLPERHLGRLRDDVRLASYRRV